MWTRQAAAVESQYLFGPATQHLGHWSHLAYPTSIVWPHVTSPQKRGSLCIQLCTLVTRCSFSAGLTHAETQRAWLGGHSLAVDLGRECHGCRNQEREKRHHHRLRPAIASPKVPISSLACSPFALTSTFPGLLLLLLWLPGCCLLYTCIG